MASNIPMMEDWNDASDLEKVDSSAISIISASGTLVPSDIQKYTTPIFPFQPYPISRSSTLDTLAISQQHVPQLFDPQHFKSVINDLNEYLRNFEKLNDQILDAMTDASSVSPHSPTNPSPLVGLEQDEVGDECLVVTKDLESERRVVAKSITNLIFVSWPMLCKSITELSTTQPNSIPMQSYSSKLGKQKMKAIVQLKQIIASFWSSQSLFQEKAQLILDSIQDPAELENEDRIQMLRSRHLNNLLSNPRAPKEGEILAQEFKMDQEQIGRSTEVLQCIWFDIVLNLESCSETAEMRRNSGGNSESFGRKILRVSKNKKQALKSLFRG